MAVVIIRKCETKNVTSNSHGRNCCNALLSIEGNKHNSYVLQLFWLITISVFYLHYVTHNPKHIQFQNP